MMRALKCRRKARHAHSWRVTEIGDLTLTVLGHCARWTRTRVAILNHSVRRQVQVRGAKWTKRSKPSHELDGLQFAAELQFQNIAEGHLVLGRQADRLQPLHVHPAIRRRQPADRERQGRLRSVGALMLVGSTKNR